MFIDRNIDAYCVSERLPMARALEMLSVSKSKILFLVDDFFRLKGAFTDGDFRRWIVAQTEIDIHVPVNCAANPKPVFSYDFESTEKLAEKLSRKVPFLPLVDADDHVVGVASLGSNRNITIGKHSLNKDAPVFTIAEIGNNHNGSVELAKRLVSEAQSAGADCVKFQMRDLNTLYVHDTSEVAASEDLGSQYVLDLLQRFQLSDEGFEEVFDYCREIGITVLCTPFDKVSVDKLSRYGMDGFKIASADLTNHELLAYVAKVGKPMIVSTGMSTEQEIYEAVRVLRREAASFILLHCNSTYPAPFKDVNLNYMTRLQEIGDCLIGYSGHERGYHVAVAAVAKGAKVIEKHFTLDRSMEGNDHKVSLLPNEFKWMCDAIQDVNLSLGTNEPRNLSQGEMMNREVLGKSIVAACDIAEGQRVTEKMIEVRSPGKGLPPSRVQELIGREMRRAISKGDFFFESDIGGATFVPRSYQFALKHGIPVRYHDFEALAHLSNLEFVEFHLSYRDLDLDLTEFLTPCRELGYAVHAPELFAGDHTLDLCALNEDYRAHSIRELQRVIKVTRELKRFFPGQVMPKIVVNVGGFSDSDFIDSDGRKARYEILAESLSALDREDVEIIAQTMPPFPWHFGGQRFHNLFVSPEDIVAVCNELGIRVCLDVSHSKLACNYFNWDFDRFVEEVAPLSAHIHIADAKGVDGEGLQVGDGEIDFPGLGRQLRALAPEATWIPEVWQGHKNGGEGFWKAFSYLDKLI
ncbi:N-acetylneuraminate synthase family protein [Marinobacter salsuginis]|uniref:TIM barrel protein n=2 Tax=Marinobacter TaxID=2742 RepID=A0A844HSK7_9GAMM|nr:N-acetylneuraminate synthase family protein [Marinobacter salsuginis]MTI97152.1 TIM barrel protein [Marinobacter adhaerens]GBO87188.1 acetylneuraminic acid synthetase [Marinobacter salsuginis]